MIKNKAIFLQFLIYGVFGLFALFSPKRILENFGINSLPDYRIKFFGLILLAFSSGIYSIAKYATPDLIRIFLYSNLIFPIGILIMFEMGILPSPFQFFTQLNLMISLFVIIELFINIQKHNLPRKSKLFINTKLKFIAMFYEFLIVIILGFFSLVYPKEILNIFDIYTVPDNWIRLTGLLLLSYSFNFYGFSKFGDYNIIKIYIINSLLFSLLLSLMIFLDFFPFNILFIVFITAVQTYFAWIELRKYEKNEGYKF